MRVLNASQMYAAEVSQVEEGMTFTRLMENAGAACARVIMNRFDDKSSVCVLCGNGKNGGDGYVIARKLAQAGYRTTIILTSGLPKAEDAIIMREQLKLMNLVPEYVFADSLAKSALKKADVIVDAIFGIGYHFRENEEMKKIFENINSLKGKKVAIDIPSGCECDSGKVQPYFIKADITIAISCLKPVHVLKPCSKMCGETVKVNIGLTDEIFEKTEGPVIRTLESEKAKALFPKRDLMGNKGTNGRVISVCGSKNMQGAACLAAKGAVYTGAGLVTAAFPECAYCAIAPKLTEPLMLNLPSNLQGTLSRAAINILLENIEKNDAVLLGCGLGVNLETKDLVWETVKNCEKPLILDADGINCVSANIDVLREKKAQILLTPHPGEMSRLTGKSIEEIESDRIRCAKEFADEYKVTVLLKGANTVIASYLRDDVYINTTGNQGMAKGGSGDLLAGIILGLVSQGMGLFDAAVLGAKIHGEAGDMAAKEYSLCGMTASDCANELKKLLKKYE